MLNDLHKMGDIYLCKVNSVITFTFPVHRWTTSYKSKLKLCLISSMWFLKYFWWIKYFFIILRFYFYDSICNGKFNQLNQLVDFQASYFSTQQVSTLFNAETQSWIFIEPMLKLFKGLNPPIYKYASCRWYHTIDFHLNVNIFSDSVDLKSIIKGHFMGQRQIHVTVKQYSIILFIKLSGPVMNVFVLSIGSLCKKIPSNLHVKCIHRYIHIHTYIYAHMHICICM